MVRLPVLFSANITSIHQTTIVLFVHSGLSVQLLDESEYDMKNYAYDTLRDLGYISIAYESRTQKFVSLFTQSISRFVTLTVCQVSGLVQLL